MWSLAELVEEVHALLVDAELRETCRAEGLWPSLGGSSLVPGVAGPSGVSVPSEGRTEAQGGDGW